MKYMMHLLITSHIILFVIALVLYIAEKTTGYVHFFDIFLRPQKSESEIRGRAIFYSLGYFSFMLVILLADIASPKSIADDFSFSLWFYAVFFMSLLFSKIYYDYHIKRLKARKR